MLINNGHEIGSSGAIRSPIQGDHTKSDRLKALWHRARRPRQQRTRRRVIPQQRDARAAFENVLFPELSSMFNSMFSDHTENDREEAVQECICQAWLAYSGLPTSTADAATARQLAARVYSQYQAGDRFLSLAP